MKSQLHRAEVRIVRGLDLDQAEWDKRSLAMRADKRERRRARRRHGRLEASAQVDDLNRRQIDDMVAEQAEEQSFWRALFFGCAP